MSARRKLSDEQISSARFAIERRRQLLRQADAYPTLEKLAAQLGCTSRYLREVVNGRARRSRTDIDEGR